jgi:hypothetical protein
MRNIRVSHGKFGFRFEQNFEFRICQLFLRDHGLFLEGVYKIELDTKTEYEGF